MKRRSLFDSGRGNCFALFLLVARCMDNRRARRRPRMEAFGRPRRFSTWLAHTDRCANLRQKSWHDPTNLPWGHRTPFGLPGQERMLTKLASQIQLEERQGHDPTPAQKLLGSAHVCSKPEHILFQKPEELFFRETQTVTLWYLLQGEQQIQGEKPAHTRIALRSPCRLPFNSDHREDQITIVLEMNLIKTANPRHFALWIGAFPGCRWITRCFWARSLQQGTIDGRTTRRKAADRFTRELAIAFQADQHAVAQFPASPQHFRGSIPTISHDDHLSRPKERLEPPKLFNRHSECCLLAVDALNIQRRGPTTRLFGPQPYHREHPANTDGFVSQRQVRNVDGASILTALRLWAFHRGGIDCHPDHCFFGQVRQHAADTPFATRRD